jgi:hypothetical protein
MAVTVIDTSFLTFASGCQALKRLGMGAKVIAALLQNHCSVVVTPIYWA